MSFIRTRTIKGRQYRYLETRYREGGKVRSKSVYLGAGAVLVGSGSLEIPDTGIGQYGMEKEAAAVAEAPLVSQPSSDAEAQPSAAPEGKSP